ncbi:unnamed protein product [Paramecium sonneborni]|uniref:Uncharacterized protein n=1 Tax=Paramecium sonneborni TaxID=65129 RepID=A0A8S1RJI2_9CILI|nr:unnamed protein product [Paramecium sonneborni]
MKFGRIKNLFYRSQFYSKINEKRKWKTNKNKVDCNKNQKWMCFWKSMKVFMKQNGQAIGFGQDRQMKIKKVYVE